MATVAERMQDASSPVVDLAGSILSGRRLLLASNRGPLEYRTDGDGNLRAVRGSGGVVTALAALSRYVKLTWVASAMSDEDRQIAAGKTQTAITGLRPDGNLSVRFVAPPTAQYQLFYNVFSNPILWFVQHKLHDM
ncbi:MAG: trehalose-6-phosphate synthase, partial [Chloroflexota bacterium]